MLIPPAATLVPIPFKVRFTDEQVQKLADDLQHCKLPEPTYESLHPLVAVAAQGTARNYGIEHEWMKSTLEYWRKGFDWRKQEERLNSVDNYMVQIEDQGHSVKLHTLIHFSSDVNAIPLLLLHGWPGSSLEFISVIKLLAQSNSPSFHIVVPNALGFGLSDAPPLDRDFGLYDVARQNDILMRGLGFDRYVVQGGDLGSVVARIMAVRYDSVQSVNINYMPLLPPSDGTGFDHPLTETEIKNAKKAEEFVATGRGYGIMHGTRPSTIGIVIQSSPIALLAWLGEKFRDWTDEPLSRDIVLETCSMWWMLETFPKAIYAYREVSNGVGNWHTSPALRITKPWGYSSFAHEIASAPQSWAAKTGDLQYYNYITRGGHFAALEVPELFAEEMRKCFEKLWK